MIFLYALFARRCLSTKSQDWEFLNEPKMKQNVNRSGISMSLQSGRLYSRLSRRIIHRQTPVSPIDIQIFLVVMCD